MPETAVYGKSQSVFSAVRRGLEFPNRPSPIKSAAVQATRHPGPPGHPVGFTNFRWLVRTKQLSQLHVTARQGATGSRTRNLVCVDSGPRDLPLPDWNSAVGGCFVAAPMAPDAVRVAQCCLGSVRSAAPVIRWSRMCVLLGRRTAGQRGAQIWADRQTEIEREASPTPKTKAGPQRGLAGVVPKPSGSTSAGASSCFD